MLFFVLLESRDNCCLELDFLGLHALWISMYWYASTENRVVLKLKYSNNSQRKLKTYLFQYWFRMFNQLLRDWGIDLISNLPRKYLYREYDKKKATDRNLIIAKLFFNGWVGSCIKLHRGCTASSIGKYRAGT